MARVTTLCTYARKNFSAAILIPLLALFLSAGLLTPAPAHAQSARDWSEAVCHAFGNCSSVRAFYYQRASRYEQQRLAALAIATRRGASSVSPRYASRFGFAGNSFNMPRYHAASSLLGNTTITPDTWKGGAGNWSTAANWSAGVPTSSSNVLICGGCGTASPVTLDISSTINNLTIDSNASLSFNNNILLTVAGGTISNAGGIIINAGSGTNSELNLGAATALSGAGTVTLTTVAKNGGNAYIEGSGFTLTNTSTIQGEGIIGNGSLGLVNSTGGVVDANSTGGTLSTTLTLNGSGGVTNTGLLEATQSGVLDITNVVNNSGGNITASGSTATVELTNGADIQGGTLNSIGGGTLETLSGNTAVTLDGSTHGALTLSKNSTYTGALNTQTEMLGTINNNGTFVLNGGAGTNTEMTLTGNTTLQGSGTGVLTMNTTSGPAGGSAYIQGNGLTLTNTNNKIQGEGVIGNGSLALVNSASGIINANSTGTGVPGGLGTTLTLNGSGGVTNTGLIEATNNGVLQVQNVVNNSGGNITANGSTAFVNFLNGANIQGGTLNTLNGATMQTVSGNTVVTLDGSSHGALTLSAGSTYLSGLNTQTNVLGTINNNGNINLQAGDATNTEMTLSGSTTLQGTGGGTVSMTVFSSPSGGNTFIQGNGFTLTNTNNTIQGEGVIGNGSLALVNQAGGTINANSTGTGLPGSVNTTLTLNGSGGITNAGLMEATNLGTLQIQSVTVNNASGSGGNITANGGSVLLENATIQGGTLTNNGGTLGTPSGWFSTVLDGRSTAQGGQGTLNLKGTYKSDYNSQTTFLGTINNTGTIQLNGGIGTNTTALMGISGAPNVTLQGGGIFNLNTVSSPGGGNAAIEAASTNFTLTNVNDTIQGSGIIGQGTLGLINQGTVNANSTGANSQTLTLVLNGSGGVTNTGLMEATNEGVLQIQNVVNNSGGNITANGATAQVQLTNGSSVQGGTLNTLNGGTILNPFNNTNVTLDGSSHGALALSAGTNYVSQLNTQTIVLGTINNSGNIQLQGGDGTNTDMTLTSNTTLGGTGGKVTMTTFASPANGNAIIQGNGMSLTNSSDTIQGAGIIGNGSLAITNSTGGTILANSPGQTLLLNGSGSITNNGTLQVAAGSTLHVQNGAFTNFVGGTLTAGTYNTAGTLEIDELGNTGGEIINNGATIVLNGPTSTFVDALGNNALSALASNSTTTSSFTVTGGQNFTTAGNFNNSGTLVVGSGSKFDVNGNLSNFSGTTLTGGTYNVTGTLQFNGANIVTNAANITLTGTTSQIIDQSSNNALANFATNATTGKFTINSGRNFTTAGNFTNNGTLTVGSSNSKFDVNGNLTNFSGTTLSSGTYSVTGTLQFNGANIVTNSANLTMTGATASIIDQNSKNGLANFATNKGTFTAGSGFNFTSAGSFTNSGTFTINSGAKFTIGGSGAMTQTAGTTTDDGTLAVGTGLSLNGGSLFGKGSVTGNVTSSGTITPGDSSTKTGILTETGAYAQNSTGTLDISIGGGVAGTSFDQLNSTSAALNGTLNLSLINGFVPTVGSTFKILNYSSETGAFTTVNGLSINANEHFTLTVQGTDVLLTVVSGALRTPPSRMGLRLPSWLSANRSGLLSDLRMPMAFRGISGGAFLPSSIAPRVVPRASVPVAIASARPVVTPLAVSGVRVPASLAAATPVWSAMSGRIGTVSLPSAPVAKSTLMMGSASFTQPVSFKAPARIGVSTFSSMASSRTAINTMSLHAATPVSFATLPSHRSFYSGVNATARANAFGSSNIRLGGTNALTRGLGTRAVFSGFAVPLSTHMSKPKFGFGVE